ncbi:MAG: DegT/DnrJ/EryC1/StrS family aminotransferase [Burkholderiales bacterium]|jgi:dTDP-4-amino-4,6-dideoxygalactose transaminase|nr:DegT/DnrJ/EryC1/StrS family aminotransferase [Burkholderiales bacterium]
MLLINDLGLHSKKLREKIDCAVKRVLDNGWFVLGPEVTTFEKSFAEYVGVKKAVSLANGTDALELALRSCGVTKGDLVATAANAGMYTTTAILTIGAIPSFMDIDLTSRTITLDECIKAVDTGVKAIVITHLYGLAAPDTKKIAELCRERNIPLIEDCAQAHGAKIDGQMVGSFGDISCFSFYPTKNLGALGDGGAIATNNQQLAETVSCLRQYGWTSKYQVTLPGASNSRLDEMQAAILSEFLPLLDSWNERRRKIADLYARNIKHSEIELPKFNGEDFVAHLYVIRTHSPLRLRDHLKNNGVASEQHYPTPDYKQPVFGNTFAHIELKNTEALSASILTLPCFPEMTDDDVLKVAGAVNSWAN